MSFLRKVLVVWTTLHFLVFLGALYWGIVADSEVAYNMAAAELVLSFFGFSCFTAARWFDGE